ncbi:MAG: MBL fold metallo-hydrolase [Desulfobacterales bacterium]|nr:MBL fold metallo-hydrolase [Desulfobacterales bacterium]
MRITTLIENRPSKTDSNLVAEWGLSLHIAFNGHEILFDTGASGAFAKNAGHLSVNIASIGTAVLSHYHYDHGGGLRRFLELNSGAKVHLGESPNGDCFAKVFGFLKKYIGLDKALAMGYSNRFETVREPVEILPDVFLIPHILCSHPKPAGNKHLFLKRDDALVHDDFAHEIIMAIKEDGKLVVFTGCSHNGILNMVDTVAAAFKGVPIKAVIGGFHLLAIPPFNFMAGSKREVQKLAKSILDYPVEVTYTGHCTGANAFGVLKSVMKDRIIDIQTGSCFEV